MGNLRDASNKFDEALKKNCSKMIEEEKGMEKIITGLVVEIGSKSKILKSLNSDIDALREDILKQSKTLQDLKATVSLKQSDIQILDKSKDELNQGLEGLYKKRTETVKIFEDEEFSNRNKLAELSRQITILNDSIDALNNDIVKLTQEYGDLKEKLSTEAQSLNQLKSEVAEAVKAQKEERRINSEERHALTRIRHEIDRDKIELRKLTEQLDEKDANLKAIEKDQEDRSVALDYRELELKNLSDKVHQLIEIHKIKV